MCFTAAYLLRIVHSRQSQSVKLSVEQTGQRLYATNIRGHQIQREFYTKHTQSIF